MPRRLHNNTIDDSSYRKPHLTYYLTNLNNWK